MTISLENMLGSIDKRRQLGFRPALVQSLVGVVLLSILIALGFWQLHRADDKAKMLMEEASAIRAAPVAVSTLSNVSVPQHVYAAGRYDSHLFLLDNRVEQGRAGYELLAPLHLAGGQAVMVNLGWRPQGVDRAHLPAVQAPIGEVLVTAVAVNPPQPSFELSPQEAMAPGWPKVLQAVVPAQLAGVLGYQLLPVVLYPDGSAVAAKRLTTMQRFGPERHRAYAAQWFTMAAVLLVIYLHHGFKRGRAL